MATTNQRGSHVVSLAVVVLVFGVAGFVGYKVWNNSQSKPSTVSSTTNKSDQAPQIKNTSDLDAASNTIDQMNDDSNTSDLNSVDKDLNSL